MLDAFREIIFIDTEFEVPPGGRQIPVCVVAKELRSGRTHRIFQGDLPAKPPFPMDSDVLCVAYYSSAEWQTFRVLGWPMPLRVLDLFTEFRNRFNGLPTLSGNKLPGALIQFGLTHLAAAIKKKIAEEIGEARWRGVHSPEEILDYCETDVVALEQLLSRMLPQIDLPRALLRGRFMVAASAIEFNGTPIDTATLERLLNNWTGMQDRLIAEIDVDYGVFDGRTFKTDRFLALLARENIPWPYHDSGSPDLSDDCFKQMAKAYARIAPLRELRSSLSELRLNDLRVGLDGRNRCLLSAFAASTGRSQPSSSRYIFGPSVWIRGLIKPPPGHGVAYLDFAQQEVGIAAALSGDEMLMEAYRSGDVYLAFAIQAGLIPPDGTALTHEFQRNLCKQTVLGIQYGMGPHSLARRLGQPLHVAIGLLRAHHETYPVFWKWSDGVVDTAMLTGELSTVFEWHTHLGPNKPANPRSLRNFPMQGNGSEMLRIACCLGTERGIEICSTAHDAVLICAPLDRLDADIETMKQAMVESSRLVLKGFEIRADCPEFDAQGRRVKFPHVIRYPDRYMDPRGETMWRKVNKLLVPADSKNAVA